MTSILNKSKFYVVTEKLKGGTMHEKIKCNSANLEIYTNHKNGDMS